MHQINLKEIDLDRDMVLTIMKSWDLGVSERRRKRDGINSGLDKIIHEKVSNHRYTPIVKYIAEENCAEISAHEIVNYVNRGSFRKTSIGVRECKLVLKRLHKYGFLNFEYEASYGDVYSLNTRGFIVKDKEVIKVGSDNCS